MAKRLKRRAKGRRFTKAHRDAKLSTIKRNVEKTYNLPNGSVQFVKPGGRRMRADAKVSKLRVAWE